MTAPKFNRPVPAIKRDENVYEVRGFELNTEDEIWQFTPGTCVLVKEQILDGENVLIALKQLQK